MYIKTVEHIVVSVQMRAPFANTISSFPRNYSQNLSHRPAEPHQFSQLLDMLIVYNYSIFRFVPILRFRISNSSSMEWTSKNHTFSTRRTGDFSRCHTMCVCLLKKTGAEWQANSRRSSTPTSSSQKEVEENRWRFWFFSIDSVQNHLFFSGHIIGLRELKNDSTSGVVPGIRRHKILDGFPARLLTFLRFSVSYAYLGWHPRTILAKLLSDIIVEAKIINFFHVHRIFVAPSFLFFESNHDWNSLLELS